MNALLSHLPWPHRPMPQALALQPVDPAPATDCDAAEEQAAACGWFDSSWELRQGLAVTEHGDFERVQFDVPLSWLLQ